MTFNGKQSDISSWYSGGSSYVPQPRQTAVKAPPPSQIPGLGEPTWNEKGAPSQLGNQDLDSDSGYVRPAKRGGLSDLLHHVSDSSSSTNAPLTGVRRNLAVHKPADWYRDNDTQKQAVQSNSQTKWTHGEPAPELQRQSNGYDDSYGDGMLNMAHAPGGDYGYSKQDSEQRYSRDQNGARYGSQDQQNGRAYDYDEKADVIYGGSSTDKNALRSANYKQTNDYVTDGYDYPQGLPQGYARDQDLGSAASVGREARQTQLGDNPAYSFVSQSDYGLRDTANANSNNNNSMRPSPSLSSLDNQNHHHHVNRMKREQSTQSDMSKLLSFGYVDGAVSGKGSSDQRVSRGGPGEGEDLSAVQSQRFTAAAGGNFQSQVNKSTSHDALWKNGSNPPSAVQEQRARRKPVDDRPDFFRIGQDQGPTAVAAPQFGRRKASAESVTTEYYGSTNSAASQGRSTFGLTKREQETRPDFLTIDSRLSDVKPSGGYSDDVDMLDRVAGYGVTPSQRSDFRRQKMDPTVAMNFATPLRSVNK